MEQAVQQIIHGHPEEASGAAAALAAALRDGSLTVLGLVALLKEPLTDDLDHEARARAVQLLSQAAEEAPAALLKGDVAVMAEFLGSKLEDWRCVDVALPGCLALLQRHQQPSLAELPQPAGVRLVQQFAAVHVQGLDYKGRLLCYEMLLEVLQGPFGVAAALAGVDLVGHMWASMERETDPRCLLSALQCVAAVGQLYQQPELSSVHHLEDNLEDIFDVCIVPYFPVIFTQPKSELLGSGITRDMLLQRVIQAMACCPQFAALAIPLISDKMGSSLRQAKEDSLQALPICLRAWGPAAVKPHMQAVWLMLKAELMAPAAAAGAGAAAAAGASESTQLGPEQLAVKSAIAATAAAALTQAVAALGPGQLDRRVLDDVAVEDLQQYLGLVNPPWLMGDQHTGTAGTAGTSAGAAGTGTGTGAAGAGAGTGAGAGGGPCRWDLPERAQARLVCIARIVAAVAAAGGASCDAVCSEILRPAVTAVLQDTAPTAAALAAAPPDGTAQAGQQQKQQQHHLRPLQADCAVLCVLHAVIAAVAGTATAGAVAAAAATTAQAGSNAATGPVVGCAEVTVALASLLPDISQMLQQLLEQQQLSAAAAAAGAADTQQQQLQDSADLLQAAQVQVWLLLLWQDVLRLHNCGLGFLQQAQLDMAAQQLVQQALHGSAVSVDLQLAIGVTASPQTAALKALELLAQGNSSAGGLHASAAADGAAPCASGMQSLQQFAAPVLLQLLEGQMAKSVSCDGSTEEQHQEQEQQQQLLLSLRAVELLQQLAGSSASAGWQVLCWLEPLVLQKVRQRDMAGLCRLLPTLHSYSLPALPADLSPEQSAAAAAFCSALLEGWQQQQQQQQHSCTSSSSSSSADENAQVHSCIFLSQLAARCNLQDQQQLMLACCEGVSIAAQDAAMVPVCLSAAVLAAARPGLLTAESVRDLVLALAASSTCSSNSSSWIDRLAAGVALAAVVNKVCGVSKQQPAGAVVAPESLLDAVLPVLLQPAQQLQQELQQAAAAAVGQRPQQQQQQQQKQQQQQLQEAAAIGSIRALSWLSRALAMQRHDLWQQCTEQVLLLLSQLLQSRPADLAAEPGEAAAAGATAAAAGAASSSAGAEVLQQLCSDQLLWSAADYFTTLVAAPPVPLAAATSAAAATAAAAGNALPAASTGGLNNVQVAVGSKQVVVDDDVAPAQLGLLLSSHTMARPLWQQKTFTLALHSLQGAATAAAASAAAAAAQDDKGKGRAVGLQIAIACLLSAAPAAIVAGASDDVLPVLLCCLVQLLVLWRQQQQQQVASAAGNAGVLRLLQLLHSCLLLLADLLMASGADAAKVLELHVEQLLAVLCELARLIPAKSGNSGSGKGCDVTPQNQVVGQQCGQQQQHQWQQVVLQAASLREVALMCLTSCTALPYHLLHPHRRQVLAAVVAALDDDRRAVRKAAVLCKASWTMS